MSDTTIDQMRKGLQAVDPMEMPMDAAFFDKLHDKIMDKIIEATMEPAPVLVKQRRLLRAHWRGWLYPMSKVLVLALVASLLFKSFFPMDYSVRNTAHLDVAGEKVVNAALVLPESFAHTILISQTESDFFVDVASRSIENLTRAQFNKIMGESSR